MQIASIVAFLLLGLHPGHPSAGLNGVWMLNHAKSNFGTSVAPEQLVVRIERRGSRLVACRISTDPDGQHVVRREYSLDGTEQPSGEAVRLTSRGFVFRIESVGGSKKGERWEVTRAGRLIIHRSITDGPRSVHQRLVLDPAGRSYELIP